MSHYYKLVYFSQFLMFSPFRLSFARYYFVNLAHLFEHNNWLRDDLHVSCLYSSIKANFNFV